MTALNVYSEFKRLYSSLQKMVGLPRRKALKPQLQIVQSRPPLSLTQTNSHLTQHLLQSEPFNFKKETTILPGLTQDEYANPFQPPTQPPSTAPPLPN